MTGHTTYPDPDHTGYLYYSCSHDPANPRHVAAHPETVKVREDHLLQVIAQFLDERVFGPDRAAHLPATDAEDTARRKAKPPTSASSYAKSTPPRTPMHGRSKASPACPKTHPPSPR